MLILIVGLMVFIGVHLVPTAPEVRDGLMRRFGDHAYKVVFSLLSLIGFALIVFGYHKLQLAPGKNPQLWVPPAGLKHAAFTLMLPAMILLVAAYVPSHIRTLAKHPMLLAIKLWALAHLLVNGDLASMVLFGGFLAYAIYDRISVKKRNALGPLGNQPAAWTGDVVVVLAGLAAYFFLLFRGHEWLIGVRLLA